MPTCFFPRPNTLGPVLTPPSAHPPPPCLAQVSTIVVAVGGWSVATGESPVARLGWSQEEGWDTHAWKEGDWWRPGDRSARARARAANAYPTADANAGTPHFAGAMGASPADAASSVDVLPAASSATSDWKIVAFASHNYLGITRKWYDRLTELGYTQHVVAAMDERLFDALAALGYRVEDHVVSPTEHAEPGEPVRGWGRHLWKLWRYRLSYVLRQTQLGRNVFLVDVDTMWNRHVPLDVLFDGTEEDRRADVFFSQGTVYPPDVFDEWGFVGCMGTVAFRATPAAQTLLRQAIRTCATGTNCDDQVAMNRALSHKYGVKWNRDSGVGVGVLGSGPGEIPELGADARPGAEEDAEDDAEPGADVPRKVFEPRVTVRMWPKPFAFRSFMKDVRKVEDPATLGFGGADAAPNQRCLGQVAPQKPRDTSAPAALGADYAQPFIVAPCLAKDGEEKVSAWNKFQRFCFVIETPEYLQTTLPEPKKTVEGAAARGQLPKSG